MHCQKPLCLYAKSSPLLTALSNGSLSKNVSSPSIKLKKSGSINKDRHIWWKIRPHTDYGTIEFRMCDAQRSIERVKMLAAICQALVYQASKDFENNI